jgi:PEGA domain
MVSLILSSTLFVALSGQTPDGLPPVPPPPATTSNGANDAASTPTAETGATQENGSPIPSLVAPKSLPGAPPPVVVEAPQPAPEPAVPPEDKPLARLLVLDLVDNDVGAELVEGLSQAVANQAVKSFAGTVITSEQLRVTLEASATQQLLGCDTAKCMADIGSTVQATVVLGGNVAKVGDDLLISLVAISPTNGVRVGEANRKVARHQDLSYYAARQLTAVTLTGKSIEPRVPVRITTSELGSIVIIDGAEIGEAPLTANVDPGNHEIMVRADGFATWRTLVNVEEASPVEIRADLVSSGFPLWPVALVLDGASVVFAAGALALTLYTVEQYMGVFGVVEKKNTYLYGTGDTYTLSQRRQQLQLLGAGADLLWIGAAAFLVLGVAVHTTEIVLWSIEE